MERAATRRRGRGLSLSIVGQSIDRSYYTPEHRSAKSRGEILGMIMPSGHQQSQQQQHQQATAAADEAE